MTNEGGTVSHAWIKCISFGYVFVVRCMVLLLMATRNPVNSPVDSWFIPLFTKVLAPSKAGGYSSPDFERTINIEGLVSVFFPRNPLQKTREFVVLVLKGSSFVERKSALPWRKICKTW